MTDDRPVMDRELFIPSKWFEANQKEVAWWGSCTDTYDEEMKQQEFAKIMGIEADYVVNGSGYKWPPYNLQGKSVLDIGGGPVSLLLKCVNGGRAVVVDPGTWPPWVLGRYDAADIEYEKEHGETYETDFVFDEVWIYNTLQHVVDPAALVATAKRLGRKIRVCEWVGTGTDDLHLHDLTELSLNDLFGVRGRVVELGWERYVPNVWTGSWSAEVSVVSTSPTFHVLGLAHTKTTRDYMSCAYTQKVLKLIPMLTGMGYEVIHYGAEGSKVPTTHVDVITDLEQQSVYGNYDWRREFFRHDPKDAAYATFNENAAAAINDRKTEGDILLVTFGNYQKPVTDAVGLHFTVESGIGYEGVYTNYRIFESYSWMHHVYGLLHQKQGSWYDAVIPNYFDLDDFTHRDRDEKEDYFLFMGRLSDVKGLRVAVEVARELGIEIRIAGQGEHETFMLEGANVKYLGSIGPKERDEQMGHAKAVFVPTFYIEPFGGVAVEAQLCGTPVITTDWGVFSETVLHGVTGYRCRTFDDFVFAARNIDKISPNDCRGYAEANYSMQRVAPMYKEYFTKLMDLNSPEGWYLLRDDRTELDWLKRSYP